MRNLNPLSIGFVKQKKLIAPDEYGGTVSNLIDILRVFIFSFLVRSKPLMSVNIDRSRGHCTRLSINRAN